MPITKSEVSYRLDLKKKLDGLNESEKRKAKKRIAEHVLSEIENYTQAGVSPVTGGRFKPLSKEYAAFKRKKGKGGDADLHFRDKMIKGIDATMEENAIKFSSNERVEASYNHNVGDTLPKRQFIPNDSDTRGRGVGFHKEINNGIDEIIREIHANKSKN